MNVVTALGNMTGMQFRELTGGVMNQKTQLTNDCKKKQPALQTSGI